MIKLGYLEDERVKKAIHWITTYQRFDDGIEERPKGWPYDRYVSCWGKHTCHMGAVKALKGLAEIPLTGVFRLISNKRVNQVNGLP